MIKEIIIKDFFSFRGENHIRLNPGINLLMGINGSGKTSFLNSIRLLYEGVCGRGFENLFQLEWGGFSEVVNANSDTVPQSIELTYVFDHRALKRIIPKSKFTEDVYYRIVIAPLGATGYRLEEKLCTYDEEDKKEKYIFLNFKHGKGILSAYVKDKCSTESFSGDTSEQELVLKQISDPRRYFPLYVIRSAIAEMSLFETFDTREDCSIRKPSKSSSELGLTSGGENVVSVLNNLSTQDTKTFTEIEEHLRIINPNFLRFNFQLFGSRIYMSIMEKNLNHTIGVRFLSDGTLRYILIMCVLLNKHTGRLIGLDEPEGRLHPDMIKSAADMMKASAKQSQLIVATHSPLLANLFELEDIIVFEKNADNATVIKYLYEEDFPEWQGEYLPGQMWLHGVIGGKRW